MPANIKLQVAEPCHESWNKMSPADQGRFCQSCQKTVTDFSMMNDKEILNYLSQKGADTCGRFTNDQLNRTLVSEAKKPFSRAYLWNIVLATFLTTGAANAQTKQSPVKRTIVTKKKVVPRENELMGLVIRTIPDELKQVKGIVLDSKTNEPIPSATVIVKGTENGVTADENGNFSLKLSDNDSNAVISVSCVGYTSQEYTLQKDSNAVSLYLEPSVQILDAIEIKGLNTKTCTAILGGMISIKRVTYAERIKRKIVDYTPEIIKKKEIKLYPNPAKAGTSIYVSLAVPSPGVYTIEILDGSGRIVYREQIAMQSKEQTISVFTNASWSKGIYWVRVAGNDSRNVFHSKLILQ